MFYVGCILVGIVAGFLSSLLGIGGGLIVVPMLLILLGVRIEVAIGTSLACIVPISLAGAFLKQGAGFIDWKVAAWVIPFGVIGAYLGHRASLLTSGLALRRIFGVLMLLAAIKFLLFPQGWEGMLATRDDAGEAAQPAAEQSHTAPPADQ